MFANWDGDDRTVDPWKSAKLVVGWSQGWDGDVLVVDKTGTNVLMDANYDIYAWFTVDFFNDSGSYTGYYIDNAPGSEKWTEKYSASCSLYDDDYALYYTDCSISGGNTESFKESWNASDVGTGWSDKESAIFPDQGGQELLYNTGTSISGKISATGKGPGVNSYLD